MQIKRARFPSAVLESGIVMILGDGRWRRYGWGERDVRDERREGQEMMWKVAKLGGAFLDEKEKEAAAWMISHARILR